MPVDVLPKELFEKSGISSMQARAVNWMWILKRFLCARNPVLAMPNNLDSNHRDKVETVDF